MYYRACVLCPEGKSCETPLCEFRHRDKNQPSPFEMCVAQTKERHDRERVKQLDREREERRDREEREREEREREREREERERDREDREMRGAYERGQDLRQASRYQQSRPRSLDADRNPDFFGGRRRYDREDVRGHQIERRHSLDRPYEHRPPEAAFYIDRKGDSPVRSNHRDDGRALDPERDLASRRQARPMTPNVLAPPPSPPRSPTRPRLPTPLPYGQAASPRGRRAVPPNTSRSAAQLRDAPSFAVSPKSRFQPIRPGDAAPPSLSAHLAQPAGYRRELSPPEINMSRVKAHTEMPPSLPSSRWGTAEVGDPADYDDGNKLRVNPPTSPPRPRPIRQPPVPREDVLVSKAREAVMDTRMWREYRDWSISAGGVDALAYKLLRDLILSPNIGLSQTDIENVFEIFDSLTVEKMSSGDLGLIEVDMIPKSLLTPCGGQEKASTLPTSQMESLNRFGTQVEIALDPAFHHPSEDSDGGNYRHIVLAPGIGCIRGQTVANPDSYEPQFLSSKRDEAIDHHDSVLKDDTYKALFRNNTRDLG